MCRCRPSCPGWLLLTPAGGSQSYTFRHHLTTSPRHHVTSPPSTPPPYLDRLWDLVDVLRLDDGPQVVLQDFGEVVLQLGASEVGQDLLPVWRILGNKDNMIVSAKPVKVCVMSCESRDRLTVDT